MAVLSSPLPLDVCSHRPIKLKTVHQDRKHWVTIQKCRKCQQLTQTAFEILDVNGQLQTFATTSRVIIRDQRPITDETNAT